MKILVTGRGKSGSWKIRGEQLGAAIGATVTPNATERDMRGFDRIILVKRPYREFLSAVNIRSKPWIWDIVDAYPQPECTTWSGNQAVEWLQLTIATMKPRAMVFPTSRMKEDSNFAGQSIVLPHHAWPKYTKQTIKQHIEVVGYEGAVHYLGKWAEMLDEECKFRGWEFQTNRDMSQADIGIALRDPMCYTSKNWKSNVKIANIQALGLPIICSKEVSYNEFGSGYEYVVTDRAELVQAMDLMANYFVRSTPSEIISKFAPTLNQTARVHREWLKQLKF